MVIEFFKFFLNSQFPLA